MRSSGASARSARAASEVGALAFVGRDRLGGSHGGLLELGRVTKPLALHLERVLVTGLESLCVLDERLQLGEPAGAQHRHCGSAPRSGGGRP